MFMGPKTSHQLGIPPLEQKTQEDKAKSVVLHGDLATLHASQNPPQVTSSTCTL